MSSNIRTDLLRSQDGNIGQGRWLRIVALMMLFAISLTTVQALHIQPSDQLFVFLPSGVMVGGFLLLKGEDWPIPAFVFVLGLFVWSLAFGAATWLSAVIAILLVSAAAVVAWLYRKLETELPPVSTTKSLSVFTGIAAFASIITGIVQATMEMAITGQGFESLAARSSLAQLLAILTVAPAMLVWVFAAQQRASVRLDLELTLIFAGMALSASVALFSGEGLELLPVPAIFLMMPWLIWSALRRPESETSTLLLATVLVAPFEVSANAAFTAADGGRSTFNTNWLIFIYLLLTGFTYFLVVKTREQNLAANLVREGDIKFNTLLNTSPDAVIVIDQTGIIEACNHIVEKLFGYSAAQLIGQNISILMPPHMAAHHDDYIKRYLATNEKHIIGIGRVVTGQRHDGSTFPVELAVGESFVQGQRFFTGFIRDLTEKQGAEQRIHELQEELMHSARLASLGEMSSMIAHEVNQPLSAAGTYMEVAEELVRSKKQESLARATDSISKAAGQVKRAAAIIRRVREFAKKKVPELAREDMNQLVEEACALAFIGTRNTNSRASLDLAKDLPAVFVDRLQIQQVVINLVRNSIDALTEIGGGEITVKSKLTDHDTVEISVSDNGPGIPDDLRGVLFTAFTTTKPSGTGLGLAVCKSIVEAHGGKLWYEQNHPRGAVFRFSIRLDTKSEAAV